MAKDKKPENLYAPKYWPLWLIVFFLWLLSHLPYKSLLCVGKVIGRLMYIFAGKLKKIAKTNINLCFPEYSEEQREDLLKKSFESNGIALMETALAWWGSEKKLKPLMHIHNEEAYTNAKKSGKRVIVSGAHFTTLELAGRIFSIKYPLAVLYRPHKKAFIEKFNKAMLEKHYVRAIKRHDARGVIKALKEQITVWYTPDVDIGGTHSMFIPFFGVQASTVTAISRFAKLSNALVIPVGFYRRDDGTGYDVYFEDPLEDFPSDSIENDLVKINQSVEDFVKKKPDQYLWQYKRFKTRPAGEEKIYK